MNLRAICNKVDMPNLVPNLDRTPIFEGCVFGVTLRMDIKNTCFKRDGLCVRDITTIIDLTFKII